MKDALFLRDEQIKDIIELILFAYRDTFSDSKNILKKHSYGTAHHKALHLIEKHKGISVNGLLRKLKITKQSLNRVLKDLERNKIIYLKKGEADARQRLIYLNKIGLELYDKIFSLQKRKIYNALKSSDADSVMKFKNLMEKITYE
jgi:DNA-binding MarR family transcriptional regulator|tara:strand:- start:2495 stop:2932 length:438 start_codon:yes stop_codon:yes gene_type:complete